MGGCPRLLQAHKAAKQQQVADSSLSDNAEDDAACRGTAPDQGIPTATKETG
jgi:hypothetical protein